MNTTLSHLLRFRRDQGGEGVISAAIVVLIMALLGAAMWSAFNGIFVDATTDIQNTVDSIGS
ncbi:hypothetical protein [Egicoccus sp. AB-alg6-2]|uniref:hypothetical protein n=1 Tax=Egicoccus sp. AB-alg6-2 TaxID=3242692 RepID=UPI00359EC1C3